MVKTTQVRVHASGSGRIVKVNEACQGRQEDSTTDIKEFLQLKNMVVKVEIQLMGGLSPSEADNFWEWKQPLWFSSLWIGEEYVLLALQNAITHVMWCGCYLENQSTKLDWINCLKGTWLFWMKSPDFVHIWILVGLNSEVQTQWSSNQV